MAIAADEDSLADYQYVTLIVRLTLDRNGRLIHGDLIDSTSARRGRFANVSSLTSAIADWLSDREQTKSRSEGS